MNFIIIIFFFSICIIGFFKILRRNKFYNKQLEFSSEYRDRLINFANKYFENKMQLNNNEYIWLVKNSNRIQNDVGVFGLMEYFGRLQGYKVSNYQIIINTIPKFRSREILDFDIMSSEEAILRHIGDIEERKNNLKKYLHNPFIWFREGVKEVLSIPIKMLEWFGLINYSTMTKLTNSIIYKIFAGIVSLITLVSGIVTIFTGYEKTLEVIDKLLSK